MPDLLRGQSHVWVLPANPESDERIESLKRILSDEEVARAARFGFERNKREYLAAHILARLMISHFANGAPADWTFQAAEHGRPELTGFPERTNLRFNLSHARGMVACALTRDDDIGVDIEWTPRSNKLADIAEKKFSAPEAAIFAAAAEEHKQQVFFSFWTLKESYIKAIGMGLREPLDGFAFDLDPLSIRFLNNNGDGDCWALDLFAPAPEYLCAVSLARPSGAQVEISRRVLDWQELEIPP